MIYYEVEGWILPSETEEKTLTQNLINKGLLVLMKRDYEWDNPEEVNARLQMDLEEYLTNLPYEYPTMSWEMDEEPDESQMENFITEILEQTQQGQSLLRARGEEITPIDTESVEAYVSQETLDEQTLSILIMDLPQY
ncbi:hypothetical protein [uncultured Prevotella sp.]|uniref:hypothetical protein n=1 Tax=uncultured Prevotella sp. TaxID=159272 RepID=UPI002607058B|nr:hypothetical protein [uncultured Prevotella sp.]